VPAKSDVYAALPSAGVSLAAAAVCARLWQAAPAPRQSRALLAALALLIALGPVLYLRTRAHVRESAFAAATLADLKDLTAPLPDGASVVLHDERGVKDYALRAAFGTLLEDAFEVAAGRRLRFWIEPPPPDAALAGLAPPCPTCVALRMAVAGGRLQRRD